MTDDNVILWKIQENIGHLILNDPPSNKMSTKFFCQLKELVFNVIPNSQIKAIVIYGNGRHFSSGAEIEELLKVIKFQAKVNKKQTINKYPTFIKDNNKIVLFLEKLRIPVIAAVRGICLGSAMELVLFCHIRICAENTVFGFPETSFNLMPGLGGTQKILKFLKYQKALELILKGSNFNAEEALKMKLIHKIIPKKEIINAALHLAKSIPENYIKEKAPLYVEKYLNKKTVVRSQKSEVRSKNIY